VSGWPRKSLSEICTFSNGLWTGKKGPLTKAGVFRNTNFRPHGILDASDIAYLELEQRQLEKRRLEPGDIIIEKSGGGPKQAVGRVAYFDNADGLYSFSNFTSAARVRDRRDVEPRYLLKFLDWCYISGLTEKMQSHSTGIRNLDFGAYKAIEVPLPPLEEQRRIVAVLDEAFAAIATAIANAEKNLANALEAPGTFIDAILEAEPDQRPMTLADAADPTCTLSYGIVQPGDDVDGGVPIVRPVDLQQDFVGLEGLKRINPEIAMAYQRTALRGDEIFLCVRGTTGTVSLASPELAGGNVTRGIVPIRFDPALITRAFGYYLMRSEAVQKQIRAATYGTALMQINIGDLKKITVRVPILERQAALSGRLDSLMIELGTLQDSYSRKIAALVQLKQSLLHRAFSGDLTEREPLAA